MYIDLFLLTNLFGVTLYRQRENRSKRFSIAKLDETR